MSLVEDIKKYQKHGRNGGSDEYVSELECTILEMYSALKWIADMEPHFAGQTPNEYHMQLKARAILAKIEGDASCR